MMYARNLICAVVMVTAFAGSAPDALADDQIKIAIGQRGIWEAAVPELGQRAGIFQKHGIKLELVYAKGAGETMQAVIPGGAEIGVAVGIMGVLRAYAKGAPVRIIGSGIKGNPDYLYVVANSPIKTLKDTDGKTIAYTSNGASSHDLVLALIKQYGLKAKLVAAGEISAIFTQVMSGHIDVGFATPPIGIDAIDTGKIRIIARGNDVLSIRDRTIRVVIANADALRRRKDVFERFLLGYQNTIDWMYSDIAALKLYAEFAGISEGLAQRMRDEFFPKSSMSLDEIEGLDKILREAVSEKFIDKPLTKEQVAELIQIHPRKR